MPTQHNNQIIPLNIVLVGDSQVGKSTLVSIFTKNYNKVYKPTVLHYSFKFINVNTKIYKLSIWDTSGKQQYDKYRPLCYQNADIFLLCFSMYSQQSFENMFKKWIFQIREYNKQGKIFVIGIDKDIGMKSSCRLDDLKREKVIRNKLMSIGIDERIRYCWYNILHPMEVNEFFRDVLGQQNGQDQNEQYNYCRII